MHDLLYLGLGLGFFLLSAALVKGMAALRGNTR